MKTIKILFVSLVIAINAYGQKSAVDLIFDKYSEKDGYSTVYISKNMFNLFANPEAKNKDDFAKIIAGLQSIKILSIEDSVLNTKVNLYKELMKSIPVSQYSELLVVKQKNQDIRMMIREKNGKILEFLMISGGEDNFLISITGNIDLNSISKLSKSMDIKGLENVDKLKTEKNK